ncbi:MAG: mannitol dehydrogenase family protein [Pseudomonadota bacterium]|nr:mannitol dehydrogenase family protein [Pseudomonadota bacterium]
MAKRPRLKRNGLAALPPRTAAGIAVELPRYERRLTRRICHIGIGRFHRAHQAHYLHRLLQLGLADGWGLCAIGLRVEDRAMLQALREQDGLYSLWQTDGTHHEATVIGSIIEMLDASADMPAAIDLLSDVETRIISLTITEAGYCLDARHALNLQHPDIVHDLANADAPRSAPGLLVRALAQRRVRDTGGVTLMSCDNLVENGARLRSVVHGFAERSDPALAAWIAQHVRFPSSMVDRITPAFDARREDQLRNDWGVDDAALVRCETWQQWILEDDFSNGRPAFEQVGVVMSDQVHAYEQLKVGLLNGGHSAISHIGQMLGHHKVHDALADSLVRHWLSAYMHSVASTLTPIAGLDVHAYRSSLIERFSNAEIDDLLARLAQDTSGKFQQVLRPPLLHYLQQQQSTECLSLGLALWLLFLSRLHDDAAARDGYLDANKSDLIAAARSAVQRNQSAELLASVFALPWPHAAAIHAEVDRHLHALEYCGLRTHVTAVADRALKTAR